MKLSLDLPVLDPSARTASAKPTRLSRDVAKFARKQDREREKKAEQRRESMRLGVIRREVFERDQSRSRASGTLVKWASDNPLDIGHAHHIVFASQGGSDEAFNRVLLTPAEHDQAHARGGKYVLDIHGDANATLRFVLRHLETGKVIREWESPCPTGGAK